MKLTIYSLLILSCTSLNAQNSAPNEIPHKRAHHQVFYHDANKAVMITGGSTPLDGGNSFKFFNDLWSFNGKTWTMAGNAGDERSGIAIAYDTKRNKLFSYGALPAIITAMPSCVFW